VWGEPANARHLEELGTSIGRCAWYVDGLLPAKLRDFSGMTSDLGDDALFFCCGYGRRGASKLGLDAELALLEALLPAFRAGHHALATLGARQAALTATLDSVAEALLVVAGDGRELHRNAALRRGPDARAVASLISPAARAAAAEREIATPAGRYVVRAVYASEHVWGTAGTVLVSLERRADAGVAAVVDRIDALTARERQVHALLVRRLTDEEIAASLGISWHTARRHTERVLGKVGVRSRRELGSGQLIVDRIEK
jgi:DNA-binding CsgD family transcriptional regulator